VEAGPLRKARQPGSALPSPQLVGEKRICRLEGNSSPVSGRASNIWASSSPSRKTIRQNDHPRVERAGRARPSADGRVTRAGLPHIALAEFGKAKVGEGQRRVARIVNQSEEMDEMLAQRNGRIVRVGAQN
jgi:hypothetical protein